MTLVLLMTELFRDHSEERKSSLLKTSTLILSWTLMIIFGPFLFA